MRWPWFTGDHRKQSAFARNDSFVVQENVKLTARTGLNRNVDAESPPIFPTVSNIEWLILFSSVLDSASLIYMLSTLPDPIIPNDRKL